MVRGHRARPARVGHHHLGEDVEVLARCDDKIIMIAKDRHLALSFHPELTQDTRIHQYWLQRFS